MQEFTMVAFNYLYVYGIIRLMLVFTRLAVAVIVAFFFWIACKVVLYVVSHLLFCLT